MRKGLPMGFGWLMTAQFLSALADNALLIVTIGHLQYQNAPVWWAPLLKFAFTLSYVFLAPFIGVLADAVCKRRLMGWMNALKLLGAVALMCGLHPMLAFALVGLGASVYAPAKYGLLTESVAPRLLVAANGWVETVVVVSVLLGTVMGGVLISPAWQQATQVQFFAAAWPMSVAASAPALNVSFMVVVAVYLLSAMCNLGIVPSGAKYAVRIRHPGAMATDFWRSNSVLWRDISGGLSLGVTSVFWAVGAMLQFAVLLWAVQSLGLTLDKAAYLQGIVAVGVMIGAMLVARRLRLCHATSVMPLGILMGVLMVFSAWASSWQWAAPSLWVVGVLGGMMVVPMNALLQHRGQRLLTAGQSIAVQGFNENLSILVMLMVYAGLIAIDVPAKVIMVIAGLSLVVFVGRSIGRRKRCESLATLLRHLVRRD